MRLTAAKWLLIFEAISCSGLKFTDHFGPYNPCIESVSTCKGNKKKDIAFASVSMNPDKFSMNITINVSTDVENPTLQIKAFRWNGKHYEQVLKFNSNKVCHHELFKRLLFDPILKLSTVNQKCIAHKGVYNNPSFDLRASAYGVTTKRFFYGKIKAIFSVYVSEGNIACIVSEMNAQREPC